MCRIALRLAFPSLGQWAPPVLLAMWAACHAEAAEPSWERIAAFGGLQSAVMAVAVDPRDSERIYASTREGVYRSTDGGYRWENILTRFHRSLLIDPQDSRILYAAPSGSMGYGLYRSTDGGESWTFHNEGLDDCNSATLALAAGAPNILFMGSF